MSKRPLPKRSTSALVARRRASTTTSPRSATTEQLAVLCAQAREELHAAGRTLHDEVGPLLSVAGLLLEQLRGDIPQADVALKEILARLDDAMEQVRRMSQRVNPVPALRTGLERALTQLAEERPEIRLKFACTAPRLPGPVVAAVFEATVAAVERAFVMEATRVDIRVYGTSGIRVRVIGDGENNTYSAKLQLTKLKIPAKKAPEFPGLEALALLAAPLGIRVQITEDNDFAGNLTNSGKLSSLKKSAGGGARKTKPSRNVAPQSTIVLIQYASRRSPGG